MHCNINGSRRPPCSSHVRLFRGCALPASVCCQRRATTIPCLLVRHGRSASSSNIFDTRALGQRSCPLSAIRKNGSAPIINIVNHRLRRCGSTRLCRPVVQSDSRVLWMLSGPSFPCSETPEPRSPQILRVRVKQGCSALSEKLRSRVGADESVAELRAKPGARGPLGGLPQTTRSAVVAD